jgi:hypothetical protein
MGWQGAVMAFNRMGADRPSRFHPRPLALLLAVFAGVALGLALGRPQPALSCGGGCGGSSLGVRFLAAFTNDDGVVNSAGLDPLDNGIDPGYEKRVAACRAWLATSDKVRVEVQNGYPSYTCRLWVRVKNTGTSAVYYRGSSIDAPAVLTVTDVTGSSCLKLKPGESRYVSFTVHIEQPARQLAGYTFEVEPLYKGSPCAW